MLERDHWGGCSACGWCSTVVQGWWTGEWTSRIDVVGGMFDVVGSVSDVGRYSAGSREVEGSSYTTVSFVVCLRAMRRTSTVVAIGKQAYTLFTR